LEGRGIKAIITTIIFILSILRI